MRGVFEEVQASTQYLIAYENKTLDNLSVRLGGVLLVALSDELQDEVCNRARISYAICSKDGHCGENG